MRFSTAAVAGFAAAAVASDSWGQYGHGAANSSAPAVWTTEVVTAFTTYCPEATVITHGAKTYSVSSATTLTITGPVTITKPVSTSVVTVCSACSTSAVVPVKPTTWASVGTVSPYKPSNGTTSAWGTGSWSTPAATPTLTPAKGDASKASFGIAGLIAAAGLVAAL